MQATITFLAQFHLGLHEFEVVRDTGLDLSSHALASPCFEAIVFLCDIHNGFALELQCVSDFGMPPITCSECLL